MNKKILSLAQYAVSIPLLLSLAACATPSDTGVLAGSLVGGATGSVLTHGSPVGTIAGAVGGALVGKEMAKQQHCYRY
jgi:osmotically inducible lipoprotein OsmB